jgi:hypothetical protein
MERLKREWKGLRENGKAEENGKADERIERLTREWKAEENIKPELKRTIPPS